MAYITSLPIESRIVIEKVQSNIPINVDELAKMLEIAIIRTKEAEGDGYLEYEDNEFTIYINSNHPSTRQRFAIAHEIGHFSPT